MPLFGLVNIKITQIRYMEMIKETWFLNMLKILLFDLAREIVKTIKWILFTNREIIHLYI